MQTTIVLIGDTFTFMWADSTKATITKTEMENKIKMKFKLLDHDEKKIHFATTTGNSAYSFNTISYHLFRKPIVDVPTMSTHPIFAAVNSIVMCNLNENHLTAMEFNGRMHSTCLVDDAEKFVRENQKRFITNFEEKQFFIDKIGHNSFVISRVDLNGNDVVVEIYYEKIRQFMFNGDNLVVKIDGGVYCITSEDTRIIDNLIVEIEKEKHILHI